MIKTAELRSAPEEYFVSTTEAGFPFYNLRLDIIQWNEEPGDMFLAHCISRSLVVTADKGFSSVYFKNAGNPFEFDLKLIRKDSQGPYMVLSYPNDEEFVSKAITYINDSLVRMSKIAT